jgi:hypothetical protein
MTETIKGERNILCTIKHGKADWIGHILCRNCLLKHFIAGKINGRKEIAGRGRKQLLDDHNETRAS